MATRYSPRIVKSGLVMCLDAHNARSYPGSGTAWYDLSGNWNKCTLSGTTFSAADTVSGADKVLVARMVFSHADDGVFGGKHINACTQTSMCWVRRTGDSGGTQTHIWGNASATSETGFQIRADESSSFRAQYIQFKGASGDSAFDLTGSSGSELTLNTWVCVAVSWDNTTTSNAVKIYINGELHTAGTSDAGSVSETSSKNTWIGDIDNSNRGFVGEVGYFLAYNRQLTNEEVLQNYNAHKGRFGL